jgi:chromosome segregation ATPase
VSNVSNVADRVSELESTIQSLETQLEDQEQEATNVIAQWQASFSEADDKCAELEKELETARAEIEKLKERAVDPAQKEAVAAYDSVMEQLEGE